MAKVISLLNQKGGVGKTTVAINLAIGLTLMNYKTFLIDGDPQGSARDWYDVGGRNLVNCSGMDSKEMSKAIQKLSSQYDVIVIDGAPQLVEVSSAAIRASDAVIVPVQASPLDIWATADLVELIKCRQRIADGSPAASFLINGDRKNTILSREMVGALLEYGLPILNSKIHKLVAYPMAFARGKSIFCERKKNVGSIEFMGLVKEVIARYIDCKQS